MPQYYISSPLHHHIPLNLNFHFRSNHSSPPMPISTTVPHCFRRRHQNLLLFVLKCAIMLAVISLFLFFLGFAALVLLHFLFVPNNRFRNNVTVETHQLLPDVVYSESAFPDSSDCCAICLDAFEEGDVSWFLPVCKHLFHARCVDRWILKRPTCPICRTRVHLDPSPGGSRMRRDGGDDDHWKRLWTSVRFQEGASSYN